jgi:hypothetical protein
VDRSETAAVLTGRIRFNMTYYYGSIENIKWPVVCIFGGKWLDMRAAEFCLQEK